jgi:hypothetical protein
MAKEVGELSGTNAKCVQCSKDCKQWSQVVVVHCPNFKSVYPSCVGKRIASDSRGDI